VYNLLKESPQGRQREKTIYWWAGGRADVTYGLDGKLDIPGEIVKVYKRTETPAGLLNVGNISGLITASKLFLLPFWFLFSVAGTVPVQ
jgi:hypothetical protein